MLALLALASTAHASGVALRWGSCAGTANRNFACDKSTGAELLVGSFEPPGGISRFSGIEVVLRITAANGSVPNWWTMFSPGSCRRTSLSMSVDMSDQFECDDPWSGAAMGGVGHWEADGSGLNANMVAAVPQTGLVSLSGGRTYGAFKLTINHQRSSGPGSCTGCEVPVCVRIEAIRLSQFGRLLDANAHQWEVIYTELTQGISGMGGASQVATWQGGTSNCSAGLAKPSTWTELKNRFRSK